MEHLIRIASSIAQVRLAARKYDHILFKPPEAVARAAQTGLDQRKEYGRGGTEVGVARAAQLARRDNVSPSTARRMKAYFDRHQVDKEGKGFDPGGEGYPSAGRIAYNLWGGEPGYSWAKKLCRQMDAADEKS